VVEGGKKLHGCSHEIIADRIVAATYLAAAAGTGGDICLKQVQPRHLSTVTAALTQAGCRISGGEEELRLQSDGRLRAVHPIRTSPYPGFPTDAQAVVMAALLRSEGTTVFVENMFENRYRHVPELRRLGADVRCEGRVAVVCGVAQLHGAQVCATDLRGGAALVAAGLQARGITTVHAAEHIGRGYADITGDLRALGAVIESHT
jgi:UDP-N-acetylglucosamine 1-carboxyvinyltransferase